MAKKSSSSDFNMSEAIRDILTANPQFSNKEVHDAIMEAYPSAKINKNSFSVAYYTGRKKLGIGGTRRGRKFSNRVGRPAAAARPTVNLAMMQAAAKYLSEVGGAEAAIEAIKQVQAVQVK